MIKIVLTLLCLIVIVSANKQYHQGGHPRYRFNYRVVSGKTGDNKGHWEHRNGDLVVGAYMLREPDGTHREVKYRSSRGIGFQAQVNRKGIAKHPAHGKSYANIRQKY
ncbi:cuticle protein 19-like isoform X2 [Armigeres subalbatus]|uniref:cuticle protein 19-like isoform X2 n=1 Tax=Armigeres subalbatus TaxID=124917 RepID=UPI002ED63CF9